MMEIKLGRIILAISWVVLINMKCLSQIVTPVHWSYGTKKITEDTYELHLKAYINPGWHIYAQVQPKNAIAQPTKIKFTNKGEFKVIDKVQELGKVEHFLSKTLGIGANQYSETVDFVQVVRLLKPVNVVNGTITYQTCTDKSCLSPETISFTIPIK